MIPQDYRDGGPVTRAMFERNLGGELEDPRFSTDLSDPLT